MSPPLLHMFESQTVPEVAPSNVMTSSVERTSVQIESSELLCVDGALIR